MLRINVRKALRDYDLDVDITVTDSETLVLMGNNGSGKTTVLNMVAGLMRPDAGLIETPSGVMFEHETGVDLPPEARNTGYVFQNYALFPHMTVFDNVAFGLRMKKTPPAEVIARVRSELESLGLWELRDERAIKLSGGQKQKVALARGIIIEPSLLMLDEPLSALDIETQVSMRRELKLRIRNAGVPAIVVTHDPADARALADVICIMDRGKIRASGKPDNIL
ncbi:MAG: ABC transporter ATP-binding protein [Methanocella sp.]